MGFKDWLTSGPVATFGGLTEKIWLYRDGLVYIKEGAKQPFDGVTARVESGSAQESHLTLGGVLKHGAFSDKARKTTGGECYLIVEGPAFFWQVEVDRKSRKEATDFAAKINDTVRKAG